MSLSEFDKGWIVGFIEGEGSFTYDIQGGYVKKNGKSLHVPRFCINQTNKAPLEFLMTFFGGGHIYIRTYRGRHYWSENKATRYDYIVRDIATLEKIKDFCEGKLKHPDKRTQFEEWKKLFLNFVGKEKQREIARQEMKKRWSDPSYRAKVLKALAPFWEHDIRSKLLKKAWETRRRKSG